MDVGQLSKMNFGTLVEILTNEGLKKVQRNTFEFKVNYFKASKIVGCKLELQALMNFDFYLGACNTFKQSGDSGPVVLLCFDRINRQECHT